MTDAPETVTEKTRQLVLFAAAGDGVSRRDALRAALGRTEPGSKMLGNFTFDATVSDSVESIARRLTDGADGERHVMLWIHASLLPRLTPAVLKNLRARARFGPDIIVLGFYDLSERAEQRSAFEDRLGILRTFSIEPDKKNSSEDVWAKNIRNSIKEAFEKLIAERTALARPTERVVERVIDPKTGILGPRGGLIAIHATKGGVGKTMIAANIAAALSLVQPTVIVDFNADGALVDQHFRKSLDRNPEGKMERGDLLEGKGLTALSSRIHPDKRDQLSRFDVEASLVKLNDSLSILPGFEDQSMYGVAAGESTTLAKQMIIRGEWIPDLFDVLGPRGIGYSYLVVDTGTNRSTSVLIQTLRRCDVLILVVDASNDMNIEGEVVWANHLATDFPELAQREIIVVANKLEEEGLYAPTLEDVRRAFAFLNPTSVMGLRADNNTFRAAVHNGIPIIDWKAYDPDRNVLVSDLKALVNQIAGIYGSVDDNAKKNPGRLLGILVRRG
jgi:MinD-like ATPase involved in chromosome partitioning or flagellar assembly